MSMVYLLYSHSNLSNITAISLYRNRAHTNNLLDVNSLSQNHSYPSMMVKQKNF